MQFWKRTTINKNKAIGRHAASAMFRHHSMFKLDKDLGDASHQNEKFSKCELRIQR